MAEAVFAKVKAFLDSRDKNKPSLVPHTLKFIITSGGATKKIYFLNLVNFTLSNDDATADVTVTLDEGLVADIFTLKVDAAELIKAGKAVVDGDREVLRKLKPFLEKLQQA